MKLILFLHSVFYRNQATSDQIEQTMHPSGTAADSWRQESIGSESQDGSKTKRSSFDSGVSLFTFIAASTVSVKMNAYIHEKLANCETKSAKFSMRKLSTNFEKKT